MKPTPLRDLLKLATPIAVGQIANIFMQLVDTMFVGRISPAAVGGVAAGSAGFSTILIFGIGLLFGVDYPLSHAYGAGRREDVHRYGIQAIYVALFLSIPLSILMVIGSAGFGRFGIAPEVAVEAEGYLRILAWSLAPSLIFQALRQYLQGMSVAGPIMAILILANGVNAFFNWVFIFGHLGFPAMGVPGSAWATLTARIFMLVALAGYVVFRDLSSQGGLLQTSWKISRSHLEPIIRLGLPSGLQVLLEVAVFALSTLLAGRLGAEAIASHQIVLQLASFTFMIPLGISAASAVLIGQAVGAGRPEEASRIGWIAVALGAVILSTCGFLMWVFPWPLLRMFTPDESVIRLATRLIPFVALFQLFDSTQVISTGNLRGIGNTRSSLVANLLGHWGLGLPVGYLLCFSFGWGVRGLWMGLSIGLVAVAIALVAVWRFQTRDADRLKRALPSRNSSH